MKKILFLLAAALFLFVAGCRDDDKKPFFNNPLDTGTTYSISGTVGGDVSAGVTITLSGEGSATTTTASNGTYSFTDLSSGSYSVTASLAGYTFSDARSVVITNADITGVDFTATNILGSVIMTQATATTDLTVVLTWTDPTDADLDHILIAWTDGTSGDSDTVEKGAGTYTIVSLDAETEYTITVSSVDTDGYTTDSELGLYTSDESIELVYSFIYTVAELDAVHDNLNGNYIMMADLDLNVAPYNADEGWTPIGYWDYGEGTGYYYTGIFNGNNHVINNLYIDTDGVDEDDFDKGLFGDIGDGTIIYNLGLESVSVTGEDYTGALVAYVEGGTIENCYATGTVNGGSYVGGLGGDINGGYVEDCHADVTVNSTEVDAERIGGLIGCGYETNVLNCYATGNVTADTDTSYAVGGLIGYGYTLLDNCYATGAVSGNEYIGGLVGDNEHEVYSSYATGAVSGDYCIGGLVGYNYDYLYNCYATGAASGNECVGGLVGYNDWGIENCYAVGAVWAESGSYYGGLVGDTYYEYACFYDIDTTLGGTLGSATDAGTPKNTTEMKTLSTFTDEGWDFVGEDANGTDDYWDIDTIGTINSGYPYLTMTADIPLSD